MMNLDVFGAKTTCGKWGWVKHFGANEVHFIGLPLPVADSGADRDPPGARRSSEPVGKDGNSATPLTSCVSGTGVSFVLNAV